MKTVIRFFAERHLFAYLFTLTLIMLGVSSLLTISRDNLPNVELQELEIRTVYPGAAPEDVELNVTNKIEEALDSVDGIDEMTSVSMENMSSIYVKLDQEGTDLAEIKREIRVAIQGVNDLPIEITERPKITEIKTANIAIIEVGLAGDLDYAQIRAYSKRFEKRVLALPGISSVVKHGYLDREIRIEVDPIKSQELQVSSQEVASAITNRNIRASAGSFESYTDDKNIVTLAQFADPLQVENVIVRSTFNGESVYVKDVAQVNDGFKKADELSRMNGKAAISFRIRKKASADIIRTVDAVKALVAQEQAKLGDQIEFVISGDTSRIVRNRLEVVQFNGLMGLVLVAVVLTLFLNRRTAFWVAVGLPVALLGTLYFLPVFGASLDSIGLAAMAVVIGIVVDDAIVVSENIARHLAMGKSPVDAAVDGAGEVFLPVLTTIITTILAFAPMFFMQGTMGKFIFVIPLVVVLALVISFFESIIALPAHLTASNQTRAKLGAKADQQVRASRFESLILPLFRSFVGLFLRFRYLTLLMFVVALGGALFYAGESMRFELFPTQSGDEFRIEIELPAGNSLAATADKVKEIEAILDSLPSNELDSYITRVGYKGNFAGGKNENWAMVTAYLSPFAMRDRTVDEIVDDVRDQTDSLSGYAHLVYNIASGGPPVGRPVQIRVVGGSDEARQVTAQSLVEFLSLQQGVTDIDRDDKAGKPQVSVELDYAKLSQLELSVSEVARALRLAYDGEKVTNVQYGDEDVDFRVILNPEARSEISQLAQLQIPNRRGRLIRLDQVAQFHTEIGPASQRHFDRDRSITVTADVIKGMVTPLEVADLVRTSFALPVLGEGELVAEVGLVFAGEVKESASSMTSLGIAFIAAVIAIYFVLVLLFNSVVQPFLVLLAVPFGLIGVIAAFGVHGQPMGFMAMLGVIGLVGVLVNDALILVTTLNGLGKNKVDNGVEGEAFVNLISEAVALRLRPIVITSLTTVAGLLPMVYGIGGQDPFMAPMALAMGYGILLATPITLVLLPSIVLIARDAEVLIGRMLAHLAIDFSHA